MSFKKVQSPAVALYSGLSAAGTSMIVTPYPKDLDGNKLTMVALGATPQVTVDPKISGYEEIIGFTGVTDNGDGTATLTGLSRDLASSSLATPGTGKQHGAGAVVILSWNPQDVARVAALENDQTFSGINTFVQSPVVPTGGTGTQAANATDIANAITGASGVASATVYGTVKTSVAPASVGAPVVVGQNDPKFVEYYVDTGAANAYVITPVISIGAYATGQRFSFKAVNANTAASTLNVNGLGAIAIKKLSATALAANDILAGAIVTVEYDGTNFQMLSQIGNAPFSATLDTDGTLAANSDTKVASQKATKTYVDSLTGASSFVGAPSGTVTSATTANVDTTYTPGFTAKNITIYYRLRGSNNGSAALFTYGIATYNGTSIVSNFILKDRLVTDTLSSGIPAVNATSPTGGGTTPNYGNVILSIINLTSTQFTVRAAFDVNGGTQPTADFYVVATK